jgi:oligosaccharide repeat unit polymerase
MSGPRQLWWLNPAWIAGLMGLIVSTGAYAIPDSAYQTFWHTPKYFDGNFLLLALGLSAAFVLGAIAVVGSGKGPARGSWQEDLPWHLITRCFWLCFYGALAGYLIWASAAVARGADLALVMGVLSGEKGAADLMKDVYLVTISGITTLTQLGLAAVILGVMIGAAKGWKKVRLPIAVLFALAMVRALFNSERLAILELAIPAGVLAMRLVVLESPLFCGRLRTALKFLPMAAAGLFFPLFACYEYFRSWSSFYSGGDMNFWQFASIRLLGYYTTALNNGALMVSRLDPVGAPFAVLHFLWRFPPFNSFIVAIYPNLKLDNADFDPYLQILSREANLEFNNSSGLFPPVVDFGIPGALLFWLLAGVLCGLLYRWFREGRISGLFFYPLFFIGVTETTRILYWGEGRVVTAYFVLLPLAWLCSRATLRERRAQRRMIWLPSH